MYKGGVCYERRRTKDYRQIQLLNPPDHLNHNQATCRADRPLMFLVRALKISRVILNGCRSISRQTILRTRRTVPPNEERYSPLLLVAVLIEFWRIYHLYHSRQAKHEDPRPALDVTAWSLQTHSLKSGRKVQVPFRYPKTRTKHRWFRESAKTSWWDMRVH